MRGLSIVVLLAAGCGFEVASKGSAIDAPEVDALDAQGTMACPWPYTTIGFDPCAGAPAEPLPDLDLQGGVFVYDTSDGTLTPAMAIDLPTTEVGNDHVLWTRSFRIGAAATLRVVGDKPFVLVSRSAVTIDGTIDAGSHRLPIKTTGAGSDPTACDATIAGDGRECMHGGSGGGGGGFGTAGAAGGAGGFTRSCTGEPANAGIPGGTAGAATADATFRAGCDGGNGANGDGAQGGDNGDGGGALHVIARDQLVVSGTGRVLAGGGGGAGGNNGRSGGGGGGSGGLIWLSATRIRVDMNGVLAANGGGGGGGADGGAAGPGGDGQPSLTAAIGGTPQGVASPGGSGATGQVPPMVGGALDRGGGGGGGGVGKIRLTAKAGNDPVITGAVITPAPNP